MTHRCERVAKSGREERQRHTSVGDATEGPFEGAGEGEAVGGAEVVDVVGDAEGAFEGFVVGLCSVGHKM